MKLEQLMLTEDEKMHAKLQMNLKTAKEKGDKDAIGAAEKALKAYKDENIDMSGEDKQKHYKM